MLGGSKNFRALLRSPYSKDDSILGVSKNQVYGCFRKLGVLL